MRHIQIYCKTILLAGLFLTSPIAQANSVTCFTTNMGQFCMELFETQTPVTTANFLKYIDNGAYTNGIFHRSMPGFIIQGGGFKLVNGTDGTSLAAVNTFAPITNEFKISNTRGTVAMAKLPNNPNSATSQWFINLADNSSNLDNQNGGFTVFGRVIFNGMNAIDAIAKLSIFDLGGNLTDTPLINFDNSQVRVSNFVQIDHVDITDVTGVFEEGVLSFAVDIGTGAALEVHLQLIKDSPSLLFELDPTSIVSLQTNPANIANFSSQTGQLHIPSVMIGANTVVSNVLMQLTDAQSFQFTLVSYE
jgi:peptidyl-prolyl cis-trans isomerase A (cyclophilin A)